MYIIAKQGNLHDLFQKNMEGNILARKKVERLLIVGLLLMVT